MEGIVVSPLAKDPSEVPEVSLVEYLLERLCTTHLPTRASIPWVVDVLNDSCVTFGELEEQSRRVASALSRSGFQAGDVLFYVTYEVAKLYIVIFAAWRLGGAVRGCYQAETSGELARQLRETRSKHVVIDHETARAVFEACKTLDWEVSLLSLGSKRVPGTNSFEDLLSDDGTAFPEQISIKPREDVLIIPSTSGSTGTPKGAILTHHSAVAAIHGVRASLLPIKQLSVAGNFGISNFHTILITLYAGGTVCFVSKFRKEEYFEHLLKHKPAHITMYPYIASWFSRSPTHSSVDLSFIKVVLLGGTVVDPTTVRLLDELLPQAALVQAYALTECPGIAYSALVRKNPTDKITLKITQNDGVCCITTGHLLPYVQAKMVDSSTGLTLDRNERGELLVKAPYLMKGYLAGNEIDRSSIDSEGWFQTGDIGFFDSDDCLYILERKSFIFKYYMLFVSPQEIESCLQAHPAVQEVGVAGVPNPETTNLARALVVLKPGQKVSEVELKDFVASRLPQHLHLHGGVRFVEELPGNRGGKLDRVALQKLASSP